MTLTYLVPLYGCACGLVPEEDRIVVLSMFCRIFYRGPLQVITQGISLVVLCIKAKLINPLIYWNVIVMEVDGVSSFSLSRMTS